MTDKKYDFAVFIGRFQPFHAGHAHIVREALKVASHLIMIVGSADRPRDIRNPFTFKERAEIIVSAMYDEADDMTIVPQVDYTYNDEKWIASIQGAVSSIVTTKRGWTDYPSKVCIVGYEKDHSTYYMKKFPLWDIVEIKPINALNATNIREHLFDTRYWPLSDTSWCVNNDHFDAIEKVIGSGNLESVFEENKFVQKYKLQWAVAPYPVTFQTVDAVVTQSGHILLVQRGAMPGKGLWALPGGFVNVKEKLLDAMVRELYEETKLKVPKPVILGSIFKTYTYDDPYRSARGRTISQAYHVKLSDREELPEIKGSDDAAFAKWVPLSEFMKMRNQMFEDHYNIVEHMLGL